MGECHLVVLRIVVLLAIGEASAIPGWERGGLSAHLPGVEAQDFIAVVLEAEVFQEVVAEVVAEEDIGKIGEKASEEGPMLAFSCPIFSSNKEMRK